VTAIVASLGFFGVGRSLHAQQAGSDGPPPDLLPVQFQHAVGDPASGKDVFRFETFGNQGFWTDAMQLPQGLMAARITPVQALQLGLSVNVDALNDPTKQVVGAALQLVKNGTDPNQTVLGDPNFTFQLINQNAVIGVVAFDAQGNRKPTGTAGLFSLAAGDKIGLTCAVCHAITDNSVLPPIAALKTRGSVGREIDGQVNHGIDVGAIFAAAQRSLAYYPMLQLQFKALKNATIGRGDFPGLLTTPTSLPTEAQADQYLTGSSANGQRYYPVGQFDAFPDGIGAPAHIMPLFRTDLSSPWGMDGGDNKLDDFNNTVYTISLDPTSVLTDTGKKFLNALAGPVGDEIAADYEQVLKGIGVIPPGKNTLDVVPFVQAQGGLTPGASGSLAGRRVDNQKLLNLNAYLNSLQSPAAGPFDAAMAARGRDVFRLATSAGGAGCSTCHQSDPNKFVPIFVIPIKALYPAYTPTSIFTRPAPFSPIQKSFGGPSPFYDNRLVVVDASRRGDSRGYALPLKLDLARRTSLLHDDEIVGATFDEAADIMMNAAKRDPKAAHPFFVASADDRKALIEYMKSLAAAPASFTPSAVVNLASLLNGPVAPGEAIGIAATALGIPTAGATMQNTTVTFDGVQAPLLSVTSTQINVIVPYEVEGATTNVQVTINGQRSAIVTLARFPAAPGIFTQAGNGLGQAAVLNQDGTVNSASNPALKGSTISIFATGGGQTNPRSVTGQVTGANPVQTVLPVTASIGGQNAPVAYMGGSPGLSNTVLQVNAMIPAGVSSGNISLVISVGGIPSQADVTVAVK
jgi:uncharacterized protein (TIGR03437 family)